MVPSPRANDDDLPDDQQHRGGCIIVHSLYLPDAINSMNEQLKREVMQLEGQIRHHQYIHERTSDVTRTSGNSVRCPP